MTTFFRAAIALSAIVVFSSLSFGAEIGSVRKRPVSDYRALRERPLFSPDRAAPVTFMAPEPEPVVEQPPAEPPPPPPPAAAPEWKLVGIVRSATLNSATFTSPTEIAAFTLRTGESRESWTLKEVGQFEVKLDGAGGRASLRFSDEASGDQVFPSEQPVEASGG